MELSNELFEAFLVNDETKILALTEGYDLDAEIAVDISNGTYNKNWTLRLHGMCFLQSSTKWFEGLTAANIASVLSRIFWYTDMLPEARQRDILINVLSAINSQSVDWIRNPSDFEMYYVNEDEKMISFLTGIGYPAEEE